jgi:hypothetical protein
MKQQFHFQYHMKFPTLKCGKCGIVDYRERFARIFNTHDKDTGKQLGRCRLCQILKEKKV